MADNKSLIAESGSPIYWSKNVEVPMVSVEISITKELYDYLMECKAIDDEKDGKINTLGEYLERIYNDQINIINEQHTLIGLLKAQLGIPQRASPLDNMDKVSPEIKDLINDPSYL